jgi:hypothetical protein
VTLNREHYGWEPGEWGTIAAAIRGNQNSGNARARSDDISAPVNSLTP